VDAPYEEPAAPDLILQTCAQSVQIEVERVLEILLARGLVAERLAASANQQRPAVA
jgi:adenylylsulfate kinase-like enzyme